MAIKRGDMVTVTKTGANGQKQTQTIPPGFVDAYAQRGWGISTSAPEPVEALKPVRKKKEVENVDTD